jgi:hypothetical protein
MIQLNDQFHEDLTTAKLDGILDGLGVSPMPADAPPLEPIGKTEEDEEE